MVEFVTKCGHRFPVVERGGSYYAITDSHGPRWIPPSVNGKDYTIAVDGIALIGTLRVFAGSRRASRMVTIHDMGLLGAVRRAIHDGELVTEDATGAEYRYGEIFHLQPHDQRFPAFRVRLDPVQ